MAIYRVPVNIAYTGAGSPGVNVWHVRSTGSFATNPSDLQGMVTAIRTFYNSLVAYFPTTQSFTLGTVTDVETDEEAVPTWATVTGTTAGGYLPQANCIVVTWKTTVAARRGRGRTFVGPLISTIAQTDGTIVDASRTAFLGAANTLVSTSTAYANGAVGVWGLQNSRAAGDTTPYDQLPHVLRDVTGASIRDLFGIMRSRRD